MTKRKIEYWVIPPEADGEFVASMEEVLDVYARPYDGRYPVLCMDEQPMQLLKETRVPIAGTKDASTSGGLRIRAGRDREHLHVLRAAVGLAGSVGAQTDERKWTGHRKSRRLLRTRYASAEKVILVCDNLNTHTKGAFYEAFEPEKARSLVRPTGFLPYAQARQLVEHRRERVEFDDAAMRHRPPLRDVDELRKETTAWHEHSNAKQRGVDWQFKVDDARVKLKSLYPKLEV